MRKYLSKINKIIRSVRLAIRAILAGWGVSFYGRKVFSAQKGNSLIKAALAATAPFMAARIGSVELACLSFYLKRRKKIKLPYPEEIKKTMGDNAGFFPVDDEGLDKFCEIFLAGIEKTDLMAVWFNKDEDCVCREFCPAARLALLGSLAPYCFRQPWSAALAGKKVLAVHPFAGTIASQYEKNRQLIFADQSVLPEFQLDTVTAVQSNAGEKTEFADWFAALASMKKEIAAKDFDVAIIGAGAYGLPLAAYVKSLGKQAVHLGGAAQILFGIKGKRWDESPAISRLYNEYWVRPSAAETPRGAEKVEGGTYW
jgi:hypothetical protein